MDTAVFEKLVSLLREKGLRLAAAESCTGGWFAKSVVDVPGASAVFLGGVVSYTNEVKEKLLAVPRALIEAHTAVSSPVAAAMAEGVREAVSADIGISVTGLAGPTGGTPDIPVGRVFIGLARKGRVTEVLTLTEGGTREDIRRAATARMAYELVKRLGDIENESI